MVRQIVLPFSEKIEDNTEYKIKKGVYDIYPSETSEAFYYVSNNDAGRKRIHFHLSEKKNVTFDFSGSTLIYHGRISPFVCFRSENIAIKNLIAEYERPFYTAGRIVKLSDKKVSLEVDKTIFPYRVEDGKLIASGEGREQDLSGGINLFLEYDNHEKRPAFGSRLYLPVIGNEVSFNGNAPLPQAHWIAEECGDRVILRGDFSSVLGGDRFALTHERRDNNVFTFIDCRNISLTDVTVYDGGSMGALFQNCENVTIEKMCVTARKGEDRLISTNCDAIHFCNCRGKTEISDCLFENMMDDGCNVHGIYHTVLNIRDKEITLGIGHFQQYGVNNYRTGDIVEIASPDRKRFSSRYTVKDAVLSDKRTIRLTVEENTEGILPGYVADDLSAHPEVHISHCRTGNNRPRGFLLNTNRKVIVEKCEFYNSDCGMEIAGDNSFWYESTGVRDVTISDNVFENCGYYGGGFSVVIRADIGANPSIADFHRNVKVINNVFFYTESCVYLANCADFVFENNKTEQGKKYPRRFGYGIVKRQS